MERQVEGNASMAYGHPRATNVRLRLGLAKAGYVRAAQLTCVTYVGSACACAYPAVVMVVGVRVVARACARSPGSWGWNVGE